MTAHTKEPKAISFASLIREIREQAGGDKQKEIAIIMKRMRREAGFREVIAPIVWAAGARTVLEHDKRSENAAAFAAHSRCDPRRVPLDSARLRVVAETMLLDRKLASGVLLRDATKADLRRQIEIHAANELGNAVKKKFYIAVDSRVAPTQRVGDALKENDVRNIWSRVGGDNLKDAA